jgi:hypothetical protein
MVRKLFCKLKTALSVIKPLLFHLLFSFFFFTASFLHYLYSKNVNFRSNPTQFTMNLSSPSPLDSILPSHPLYNNYEEENMFPLETKLDPSALKSVFSASPFPSQSTSSKPLSKKKASKRRSQVKNACGSYPFSVLQLHDFLIHVQQSNIYS